MTNQSHTELAAQARRAAKSLEILDMENTAELMRQCAAALESPERVQGEAWQCDWCGHENEPTCRSCSHKNAPRNTPPTAPAQDAQEKKV